MVTLHLHANYMWPSNTTHSTSRKQPSGRGAPTFLINLPQNERGGILLRSCWQYTRSACSTLRKYRRKADLKNPGFPTARLPFSVRLNSNIIVGGVLRNLRNVLNPKNNMSMWVELFLQAAAVKAFAISELGGNLKFGRKNEIEKLTKPSGLSFGVRLRRT